MSDCPHLHTYKDDFLGEWHCDDCGVTLEHCETCDDGKKLDVLMVCGVCGRSLSKEYSMEITDNKLRTLLREAFVAGFDASGEGYNGELMHDGMGDPDKPKQEAKKFANARVVKLKKE